MKLIPSGQLKNNLRPIKVLLFHLIIYYSGTQLGYAQTKEWILPLPGDPGTVSHVNTYSFQTQNYLCWVERRYMGMGNQELNLYNGIKWKKIVIDTPVIDIFNMDEQNDSIVLIATPKPNMNIYGDRILFYDGMSWTMIAKLDALSGTHKNWKGLGLQDIKFYRHKLYGTYLTDDYNCTLVEYDFNTNSIRNVATFQQNRSYEFYNQASKMKLYVDNDRLYMCGAYDSINHVASQGFGYFDGTNFVNKKIFPTSIAHNCVVVNRLDSDYYVVERYNNNGSTNDVTKTKLYLMSNDSIVKDVSGNLFTQHKKSFALLEIAQYNLEVFRLNGKIVYFDRYYERHLEYDESKNEWSRIDFITNDGYAFFYKGRHYIFCTEMVSPYASHDHACFIVKPSFSVSGYAYVDMDSNCVMNNGDSLWKREWVTLRDSNSYFSMLTDKNGAYEIPVSLGKYWFRGNNPSLSSLKCNTDTLLVDSAKNYQHDVSFSFVSPYDKKGDAVINASGGMLRRGQNYTLTMHLTNKGRPGLMVTPTLKYDRRLNFVSSDASIVSNSGGVIVFGQKKADFFKPKKINVVFYADPDSVNVSDKLKFGVSIDTSNSEITYANNRLLYEEQVRGPFDPNAITSNPENDIVFSPGEIQYTVEFQNLGNDTAFNVRIKDAIPSQFDLSSIKVLDHSGPEISATASNGVLEFQFNGIKLTPSTTSVAGSKGYVTFSMMLKDPLAVGQSIFNKAGIFFDYEDEVVTNATFVKRIDPGSAVAKINATAPFKAYPNPANRSISIEGMNGAALSDIKFYTVTGIQVQVPPAIDSAYDISGLPAGLYIVSAIVEGQYYSYVFSKTGN